MKLYGICTDDWTLTTYYWANDVQEALRYHRERYELPEGAEIENLETAYEVKLQPGPVGTFDLTDPEEPFDAEEVYKPELLKELESVAE